MLAYLSGLPYRRALLWLLGAAILGRLVVAFATYGLGTDIQSFVTVKEQLNADPLHLYGDVNRGSILGLDIRVWPYAPGFFPFIAFAALASKVVGPFDAWIQLPAILADACIAWLVQDYLGRRGASERMRLAGAALVAVGPAFFLVSGYHGQLDSVAVLPAVAALWLWDRADPERRALWCGALVGTAGAIKTAPLLMLLALLPAVRSRREGAALVLSAIAVPFLLLLPFLAADFAGVRDSLGYAGFPGVGGASLALQPDLTSFWIRHQDFVPRLSDASQFLLDHGIVLTVAAFLVLIAFLARFRPAAIDAAVLVWLVAYSVNSNFFFNYLVWGLPFLIMAGFIFEAALIQIVALPAELVFYFVTAPAWLAPPYVVDMMVLWLLWMVGAVLLGRRIVEGRRRHPQGVQPPLVAIGPPRPAT
jgi:hypothetical protein